MVVSNCCCRSISLFGYLNQSEWLDLVKANASSYVVLQSCIWITLTMWSARALQYRNSTSAIQCQCIFGAWRLASLPQGTVKASTINYLCLSGDRPRWVGAQLTKATAHSRGDHRTETLLVGPTWWEDMVNKKRSCRASLLIEKHISRCCIHDTDQPEDNHFAMLTCDSFSHQ